MSGPNVTYACQSCGGPVVQGIPHHCSGTAALRNRTRWESEPPVPFQLPAAAFESQPAAPTAPDYTALLTRIAEAVERIADRLK